MGVEQLDGNFAHLYPAFALKVKATLAQVTRETLGKFAGVHGWCMVEGFRSQARQDWLYAQGRSRQGAIVTHKRVSNHSGGMAADLYPVNEGGEVIWEYSGGAWDILGHCARAQGLQWGGDYPKLTGGSFVDQPHIEPPLWQRILWRLLAYLYLRKLGI